MDFSGKEFEGFFTKPVSIVSCVWIGLSKNENEIEQPVDHPKRISDGIGYRACMSVSFL